MAFKIGDTVKLKSGGPTMTVREVRNNNEVLCEWFNQEGDSFKLDRYIFHEETIKAAKVT